MKNSNVCFKRISVILLSAVMILTMMPFAGEHVHAADKNEPTVSEAVLKAAEDAGIDASDKQAIKAFSDALDEQGIDIDAIELADDEEEDVPEMEAEDAVLTDDGEIPLKELQPKKARSLSGSDFSDIDPATAVSIAPNGYKKCTLTSSKQEFVFKFVPAKSGTYYFYATGDLDTFGRVAVYNPDTEEYDYVADNDDGGINRNFKITLTAEAGKEYYLQAKPYYSNQTGSFNVYLDSNQYTASVTVSLDKKTGVATVKGNVTGDAFNTLYVDSTSCDVAIGGKKTFTAKVKMKNYSVGYHRIYATLINHESAKIYYKNAVPTYIYGKPSIKLSDFTTGVKYFSFSNNNGSYSGDSTAKVYIDYKQKGGKWKNNLGPIDSYGSKKKGKLKPNKWYYVRAHYGKKFKYKNKTYFWSGKSRGKVSKTFKIKTGKAKKLKVKSIKISNAKVRSSSFTYILYIGSWGYPRTITYYYTTFDVTVKLKKKPGTKGICINKIMLKGNKKKYKTSMSVSGKVKGHKIKFSLCSYQNATYKGYSKVVKKKAKVK